MIRNLRAVMWSSYRQSSRICMLVTGLSFGSVGDGLLFENASAEQGGDGGAGACFGCGGAVAKVKRVSGCEDVFKAARSDQGVDLGLGQFSFRGGGVAVGDRAICVAALRAVDAVAGGMGAVVGGH